LAVDRPSGPISSDRSPNPPTISSVALAAISDPKIQYSDVVPYRCGLVRKPTTVHAIVASDATITPNATAIAAPLRLPRRMSGMACSCGDTACSITIGPLRRRPAAALERPDRTPRTYRQ
jgi:hypothetical protein